ncbi:GDP-mannose 4,6-dehydratase [Brucellaceae bacterium D45D]
MSQHRVLITGASGFVGTWLLRAFQDISTEESIEIVTAGRGANCDIDIDIVDRRATERAVRDASPTALVHLAAIAAPMEARSNPSLAWDVNLSGTLNLARAVLKEVPECRFIHVGSSETYGYFFHDAGQKAVKEDSPLKPMTTYGATKAAADIAIGQMSYDGLRSIRFRPFNHTGPGQSDSYVVPAFASQVAKIMAGQMEPIIKVGNLSAARDFLDVRDVVRAYARVALGCDEGVEGRAFNLASGKAVRIQDILDTLIHLSGMKIEVAVSPDRVRPVDIPHASGDINAAKQMLNWKPDISLDTTISDVLEDWRQRV